jgi:hypothetical protein
MLSVGSPYTWQPFASHKQRWMNPILLPRKRARDTIPSTLAHRSAGPPPNFSANTTIEAVMKAKHLLTVGYIGLLTHNTSM